MRAPRRAGGTVAPRGPQGAAGSIISNKLSVGGPALVSIARTDKAFKSTECGTWRLVTAATPLRPAPAFANGTRLVNREVTPGTYIAPGGRICYWERLRNLSGEHGAIVVNEAVMSGQVVAQVDPTDVAFGTYGCGTWRKG